MVLIIILRFYLAKQNILRERELHDALSNNDVYIKVDGNDVKIDRVRLPLIFQQVPSPFCPYCLLTFALQ